MQSTMAMTSIGAKGAMTARERSSSSYVFMPEYTTRSNRSQMFFIVFLVLTRFLRNSLCNFFAFPLDRALSINFCKSLVIKELRRGGGRLAVTR